MQSAGVTSGQLVCDAKKLWAAWRSSEARERYINFLLIDGCSSARASMQADFDFDAHTQRPEEQRTLPTIPEDEIEKFEHTNKEMKLWSLWSSSNARVQHITFLLVIGFAAEAAAKQADIEFKAHSSGYEGTPKEKIKAFEQYSLDKSLKHI